MASLVRWDPFHDIVSLQRDMNRLFSEMGMGTQRRGDSERATTLPAIDVMAKGEDLVIRAEMPGITPDNIDISVTDDVLTLHGERHAEKEAAEEDYLMHETSWGSFNRTMRLPEGTDIDDISADFHDGILEVTVPKAAERATRTRKIEVAAHEPKKLKSHH